MTLYQTYMIDTKAFERFFTNPSDSQLHAFAKSLGENPQANDWHTYAVVLPIDASEMLDVFKRYESLVKELVPRDSQLARHFEVEGPSVGEDVPHLLKFLRKLIKEKATWYAPIDC